MKKFLTYLSVAAAVLGSVLIVGAPAEAAGCTIGSIVTVGHTTHTTNNNVWSYTNPLVKPAPGCNDIQVRNLHNQFRDTGMAVQIEWLNSANQHIGWGTGGQIFIVDYTPWQIVEYSVPTGRHFKIWIQDDGLGTSTGQYMD